MAHKEAVFLVDLPQPFNKELVKRLAVMLEAEKNLELLGSILAAVDQAAIIQAYVDRAVASALEDIYSKWPVLRWEDNGDGELTATFHGWTLFASPCNWMIEHETGMVLRSPRPNQQTLRDNQLAVESILSRMGAVFRVERRIVRVMEDGVES